MLKGEGNRVRKTGKGENEIGMGGEEVDDDGLVRCSYDRGCCPSSSQLLCKSERIEGSMRMPRRRSDRKRKRKGRGGKKGKVMMELN